MSHQGLHLLLVEDNEGDALLIREMFSDLHGTDCKLAHARTIGEAERTLAGDAPDAVLLDLSLPDGRGLGTLERIRRAAGKIPVIVLTGLGDDSTALRAVQEGAQDYLVKGEFDGRVLLRSVRYAIERNRAERIEQERRGLESALSAMDHLLGVLGHELRTPLTALRLMSEYMLSDQAIAVAQWDRFLGSINGEVLRMTDMVNNLLEAARLDSGVSQWRWGTVEAAKVCGEALSLLRPLLNDAPVELRSIVEPENLVFSGDPDAIRRLLVNLVSNGIKHTRKGSIEVALRSRSAQIVVTVTDTGTGIPEDVARRLGTAFAINSGIAGSSTSGGTGLGLAICKGIAAVHGGVISVSSKVGVGAVFTVTLRGDLEGPAAIPENLKIIREAAA
jgi:signal transduction histidine kinase